MIDRKAVGDRGEKIARQYFTDLGFVVVAHNFRTRWGEIDLVLRRERAFRFVEVKLRRSLDYGLPQDAVVRVKQRKVRQAALWWLRLRQLPMDTEIHFDVLAIREIRGQTHFEYLEDAF